MNTQQNPMARALLKEAERSTPVHLERQMQQVQNEIDFVEILCNFWPLPNMTARRDRLERQMAQLVQIHQQLQEERSTVRPLARETGSQASIFNPATFAQKMYPPQAFGTRFTGLSQQAAR